MPSRLGEPSGFGSLYTYLVAPAWWLDPTDAWEAAKLIGVLVMTAAIFPAYGLARFVVSRPWAVAAAIGAVAAPPLAYAPYLLEEPLAYPFRRPRSGRSPPRRPADAATARPRGSALPRRPVRPRRAGGAAGRLRRRRSSLPPLANRPLHALARGRGARGDWVGAAMLVVGAVDRLQRRRRPQVRRVVRRDRLREAPRARPRPLVAGGDDDRPRRAAGGRDGRRLRLPPAFAPRTRAARSSSSASRRVVAFVTYAAVKGAYLSTVLLRC